MMDEIQIGDKVYSLTGFNRVVGIIEQIEDDAYIIRGKDLFDKEPRLYRGYKRHVHLFDK